MIGFTEDYYMDGVNKGVSNYENYRWLPELTIQMAKFLKQLLGINNGETILDFGCARGYVVKALRMLGVGAYGYDISKWAIENCDPDVKQYVTDHGPWEIIDNCDYLFCKDVLEHIHTDDLNKILPWLFSKTKKNALFIVPLAYVDDGRHYHSPDDEKDVTHIQRLTLNEWLRLLGHHAKNHSVFGSTSVPILKPGAFKYPGSVGFIYCVRHTDESAITIRYDFMMDKECVNLCDILNSLPGIVTESSCCGHGTDHFSVAFTANTIESLARILEAINEGPYWSDGSRMWVVEAHWANGSNSAYFYLKGPIDQTAGDTLADTLKKKWQG